LRDHTILSSWIIRITHRATLHYLKQGHVDAELIDEVCGFEDVDTKQLEQMETQFLVRQALDRLDEPSRQLIQALLMVPPPTYEELAKKLNCPVGSIGPTRARAIKKLKKILLEMDVHLV
jgi:RNA polymerase sigma factor (sigma-70 family)